MPILILYAFGALYFGIMGGLVSLFYYLALTLTVLVLGLVASWLVNHIIPKGTYVIKEQKMSLLIGIIIGFAIYIYLKVFLKII